MRKANPIANRFTVQKAQLPIENGLATCYLVLDDGVPSTLINNAIIADRVFQRAPSTNAYCICKYLNYLDSRGIECENATMTDIYSFLKENKRYKSWSHATLLRYISVIGNVYETLSVLGFKLNESLYSPLHGTRPTSARSYKEQPDTKIRELKRLFGIERNNNWESYTKWYTPQQIKALSEELPLVHRIIFLLTVFYGYRCSTAISLTMSKVNLRSRRVTPTYSKTKKVHTSVLMPELVEMIRSYIQNERSMNKGSGSEYLFLTQRGTPMTYQSYNAALKRAAERVREKYPELDLGVVHTHAGRSTFAATLRSYQLKKQRLGEETFSDSDFCALMDWKSLDCLTNYDKATRIQETYEIFTDFQTNYMSIIEENEDLYRSSN